MFSKLSKHSSVKNILVISLSNIGDIVLVAPAIDILLRDFPHARISLVIGAKAVSLFEGNERIDQIHIFDKTLNWYAQAQWTFSLKAHGYDLVVDFRNSMIGYFLFPQWITPPLLGIDKNLHLKDQHLARLRSLYEFDPTPAPTLTINPTSEDEIHVQKLLDPFLSIDRSFVVIAPIAADSAKTWSPEGFSELMKVIVNKFKVKVVMIGSSHDRMLIDRMITDAQVPVLNLAGELSLIQSVALIRSSKIAIVHDSGPMHIASYYNKPMVALFGPTDPKFSRPWSQVYKVVRCNDLCQRCIHPQKREILHNCMSAIRVSDVQVAFEEVYEKIQ